MTDTYTLECETEEIRTKVNEPVQSENKRRRFCKPWIKTDKNLVSITKKMRFSSKKDWLLLLPPLAEPLFTVKDVFISLKENGTKTFKIVLCVDKESKFATEYANGEEVLYSAKEIDLKDSHIPDYK